MQNEMEKIERLKFTSGMLDQLLSEGDMNMSLWKEAECQALGSLSAWAGDATSPHLCRAVHGELFACCLEAGRPASSITGEREKDAYLFFLFVFLKSCALHPSYSCLQGIACLLSALLPCPPSGLLGAGSPWIPPNLPTLLMAHLWVSTQ